MMVPTFQGSSGRKGSRVGKKGPAVHVFEGRFPARCSASRQRGKTLLYREVLGMNDGAFHY